MERSLLVVSDTHVSTELGADVERDLARLVERHRGSEIILAGDVFDLSFARAKSSSAELLAAVLGRAPHVMDALRKHLGRGDPVTLVPGNHDAALADGDVEGALVARLGLSTAAPIRVMPWFVRRGALHIEHGHVYDPDNAPVHPLATWNDRTEPLGVALIRRFVAPTGAVHFAHAQYATPLWAIRRAFALYGHRAPWMIASYFKTAIRLCFECGPTLLPHAEREREVGAARLLAFAEASGVSERRLAEILEATPRPTHLSRRDVFFRLYFDRVFAALVLAASLPSIGRRPFAGLLAAGSLAYLAGSAARGKDRYGELPNLRLRDGAERIRELTGARVVIFGHTHHETVDDGYVNSGSFAFPRGPGRPYVAVDERGTVELRRFSAR